MKIVVNDIAADEYSGGAFTVLKDFYKAVREYGGEHEWVFLLAEKYFEETETIKIETYPEIKKSWFKRLAFDFFSGKKILKKHRADVYFSLQNTAIFGTRIPQIVYLHQPLPYQKEKRFSFLNKRERKLAVYQRIIGKFFSLSLKKANHIIVQTEWMKKALDSKLSTPNIVSVIPPTLSIKEKDIAKADPASNLFFYPAANYIYKNHDVLFRAAEILNKDGVENYSIKCTLKPEEKENYSAINEIEFIGSQTLDQVYHFYQHSVLVFPSYIETFGLPLLEARTFQTIILAADTSFAREILEGYPNAYFFPYQDEKALAKLLRKCILKEITVKKVESTLPLTLSKENSWKQVIDSVVAEGTTSE